MKAIVGLGNPGRRYAGTRHNLGFMAVQLLAERAKINILKKAHQSLLGHGRIAGERVILALPQTYMNLSGQSVRSLVRYYKLLPTDILVIHDDLDISAGKIKLSFGGGAGGHKGIASISENLHNQGFARIRVGLGRPDYQIKVEEFVLGTLRGSEKKEAKWAVEQAADAAESILTHGFAKAQTRFNRNN